MNRFISFKLGVSCYPSLIKKFLLKDFDSIQLIALNNLNQIIFGLGCSCKVSWFNLQICFTEFELIHYDLQVFVSCLINCIKSFWIVYDFQKHWIDSTFSWFDSFCIQNCLESSWIVSKFSWFDSFFIQNCLESIHCSCLSSQSSCQPNIFILHY